MLSLCGGAGQTEAGAGRGCDLTKLEEAALGAASWFVRAVRAAGRSPEAGGLEGHWGRGGGEQWRMEVDLRSLEVREEVETWMKNPRRLKGSGE